MLSDKLHSDLPAVPPRRFSLLWASDLSQNIPRFFSFWKSADLLPQPRCTSLEISSKTQLQMLLVFWLLSPIIYLAWIRREGELKWFSYSFFKSVMLSLISPCKWRKCWLARSVRYKGNITFSSSDLQPFANTALFQFSSRSTTLSLSSPANFWISMTDFLGFGVLLVRWIAPITICLCCCRTCCVLNQYQ